MKMIQITRDPIEFFKDFTTCDTPLLCVDCGVMDYEACLALQLRVNQEVSEGNIPSVCLLVEHPPVITFGIHGEHNLVLSNASMLKQQGIALIPVRRGGGATMHNPGQLVVYPIIRLADFGFRVAPFVHWVEQIGMDLLSLHALETTRRSRFPGLWIGERKIASIGLQIQHGTSMHGIAVNVCNDLTLFEHIVPCGIEGVRMTSLLCETGLRLSLDQARKETERIILGLLPVQGVQGRQKHAATR